jgi:preprotein translocase subunit SecD
VSDTKGGTDIFYQVVQPTDRTLSSEEMAVAKERTLKMLLTRVADLLDVPGATAHVEGEDQIVVHLPGFTVTRDVANELSYSGRMELYHAKNLSNQGKREYQVEYRPYTGSESFSRKTDGRLSDPGDPGYDEIIRGWGAPIATSADLTSTEIYRSTTGRYEPRLHFNDSAAKRWSAWSVKDNNNQHGELIGVVIDGVCIDIGLIKVGDILGSDMALMGPFTTEYVKFLVGMLNAGPLPVGLKFLKKKRFGIFDNSVPEI